MIQNFLCFLVAYFIFNNLAMFCREANKYHKGLQDYYWWIQFFSSWRFLVHAWNMFIGIIFQTKLLSRDYNLYLIAILSTEKVSGVLLCGVIFKWIIGVDNNYNFIMALTGFFTDWKKMLLGVLSFYEYYCHKNNFWSLICKSWHSRRITFVINDSFSLHSI